MTLADRLVRAAGVLTAVAVVLGALGWANDDRGLHLAAVGMAVLALRAAGASWIIERIERREDES